MNTSFFRGIVVGFILCFVVFIIGMQVYQFYRTANRDEQSDPSPLFSHTKPKSSTALTGFQLVNFHQDIQNPKFEDNQLNISEQRELLKRPSQRGRLSRPLNPRKFNDVSPRRSNSIVTSPLTTIKALPSIIHDFADKTLNFEHDTKSLKQLNFTIPPKTKEQCLQVFGKRRFYTLDEKRLPPMLYTFPGSGNTWSRLLIEYATGIYTGSVYNDKSLLEALPGEFSCDWRVSVIKVHPHTHPFGPLRDGTFHSDENKCKRGNIHQFKRSIMLIRNPFDSIWSEYQRRVTQSHVEGILKQSFQWNRWQANAAQLSHAFYDMWEQYYTGIEKAFPSNDYLYIRYEDLKNKSTRIETLNKIVKFLNLPTTKERLECAFIMAENKNAHRSIDTELEMTKDIAYTKPLVCRMWKLFGKYCEKHNYSIWGNIDCSKDDYQPIPRVNVGPRGEYDHSWVKAGQKLLDFGGYDKSSMGSDSSKPFLTPDIRINQVKRLSHENIAALQFQVRGMNLMEAMSVSGLGRLGEEGPTWK